METPLLGLKWPGSNPRISESSEAPVFAGPAGPATCYSPTPDVTVMIQRRSGTGSRSLRGQRLARAPRTGTFPQGGVKRSRNMLDRQRVENLTRDRAGSRRDFSATANSRRNVRLVYVKRLCVYLNRHASRVWMAANEAGMLLIENDLMIYVGNLARSGPDGRADGWRMSFCPSWVLKRGTFGTLWAATWETHRTH
jgi:hypothetical protein